MIQYTRRMVTYPRQWIEIEEHDLVARWRDAEYSGAVEAYRRKEVDQLEIGGAALAARFDPSGESRMENILHPNGYVIIDYDDLGDTEIAAAFRDLVGRSERTRIAAISKSGNGVHVVTRVGKDLNILGQSWYSVVNNVIQYYDDLTGYQADRQASGMARVLFDTYDPNLIYRPGATFPLPIATTYNGEERRINQRVELDDGIWPRIFGALYSIVKADLERDGRIRHSTISMLLALSSKYADAAITLLRESRSGSENWEIDELTRLADAFAGPLGLGSIIYAAQSVPNLRVEGERWLAEHGWELKVQFDRDVPWMHSMANWEAKLNAAYNNGPIPGLAQGNPNGLRWVGRDIPRVELGDIYRVFGATAQYRTGTNNDANPPSDLIRMAERWTYSSLPEIDRVANTARVVNGRFYGENEYVPDYRLLIRPERQLQELYSIDQALAIWNEFCGQFAFASEHDRLNLLLLHLSPILRNEAYGWPICLVTKPNRSVGGTKALQSGWYGLRTSDFRTPSIPMSRTLGARMVDTVLASDKSEIYLDNIYTLNYTSLKNLPVSAEVMVDPKMQRAQSISTRNLTVFADGINVSLDSEMKRRVLAVQLTEEAALRARHRGYSHPVLIRDIQQSQDFTDALLSLGYHYTQQERVS